MELYDILLAKKLGGGGGVTPTGTKSITSNGTYDVASYASAHVSVPGIVPSGTYNITENGTYNVTNYASASVSVTAPAVNIQELTVTENGTYTASGSVDGYSPVTVNVSGGGGGGTDIVKKWAEKAPLTLEDSTVSFVAYSAFAYQDGITSVSFPNASYIGNSAFTYCSGFATVSFPNATSIGSYAFYSCYSLTTASFPNATSIGNSAFATCRSLTTVSFPNAASIGNYAFANCRSLTTVSFPNAASIGNNAFASCYRLVSLYLMGSSVPTLGGSSVFQSTPIGGYSASAGQYGSVFVPASLYNSYITANNWSSISARIVSV